MRSLSWLTGLVTLTALCKITAAEPSTAPLDEPAVKLLQAGRAPRRALLLKPTAGSEQSVDFSMHMKVEQELFGNKAPPAKIPTIKVGMKMKITQVAANGDARYEFQMTKANISAEAGVLPQVEEAMRKSLDGVVGLGGSGLVTSRGMSRDADVKIPAKADPQMRQMMEGLKQSLSQMATPFPEEAVGVGGKWQVASTINQNGMKVKQVSTFELVSLEGSRGTIRFQVSQTAAPQTVEGAGMPPGTKVRLVSLRSQGNGQRALDLTQLVPSSARASLTSDSKMQVDSKELASTNKEISTKMTMDLNISAK